MLSGSYPAMIPVPGYTPRVSRSALPVFPLTAMEGVGCGPLPRWRHARRPNDTDAALTRLEAGDLIWRH